MAKLGPPLNVGSMFAKQTYVLVAERKTTMIREANLVNVPAFSHHSPSKLGQDESDASVDWEIHLGQVAGCQ